MLFTILIVLLLILFDTTVNGQQQCNQQLTCNDCITSSPSCIWCSDENYNSSVRCLERGTLTFSQCRVMEDPISIVDSLQMDDNSLVNPREVTIGLRPGIPVSFNVSVQSARNFPLDMYFLLDVSGSLSDDLLTLRTLSSELTSSLSNISSNFKIGLGTFIDKPTLPYSAAVNLKDTNGNCIISATDCAPPHSYRHILSLTDNETQFIDALDSVEISHGLDIAEAGFDAILQSVACQSIVGWRSRATHIIVYITDAATHLAGDGKLAGITRPGDGQCHMEYLANENYYEYTSWNSLDYSSFGQIESLLRDTDTSVILAVQAGVQDYYGEFVKNSRRMFLSLLENRATNVVQLIERQYEILLGTIGLEPIPFSGLTVDAVAIDGCDKVSSDGTCLEVPVEQTVVFNVTVTAANCVTNGRSFDIRVRGFGSLTVTVDSECSCDCLNDTIFNSSLCRDGAGDKVCGICVCNKDQSFDCLLSSLSSQQCSERGQCSSCGECICDRISESDYYFGDSCQCDTFSCAKDDNGRVCGGNGLCCNGMCQCSVSSLSGLSFTGATCDCSPDNSTCLNLRNEICSNHGQCECNQCRCTQEYAGNLCQECIRESCSPCNIRDKLLNSCVQCFLNLSSINCTECPSLASISLLQSDEEVDVLPCTFQLESCTYQYHVVRQDEATGQYIVLAQGSPTSCGSFTFPIEVIAVLAILIPLLIIILGIILLVIIKAILVYRERVEFKKFQQELEDANWGENANPLYVSPEMEYKNIVYRKKKSSSSIKL